MNFVNPADALRARVLGRLNCAFCTHLLPSQGGENPDGRWCVNRMTDPNPNGRIRAPESICRHFADNVTERLADFQ